MTDTPISENPASGGDSGGESDGLRAEVEKLRSLNAHLTSKYESVLRAHGELEALVAATQVSARAGERLSRDEFLLTAESEERLRLANEAAGIGTFSIDVKSGLAHYSPELTTMLGVPGTQAVKVEQALQRVHRDDLPRVRQSYLAAQDPSGDGRLRMEFRFVRPGGEVRWMTWNGRFQFADTGAGREAVRIVGACVDTTDRKQAEADLRISEARYRHVVEGSLQGIIIQQNERIVYANPAMAKIFGYDRPEDMIGKSTFDDFVAPEERALLRARTAAAYRGEPLAPHPGWRGFRKDGTEIWVSAVAHLAEWHGRPAVVSFYLDITERKASERRLNEALRLMKVATAAGRMGTWHFDPDGNKLFYSDEGLELLGIDRANWNNSIDAVEAVLHPDDIKRRRKIITEAIAAKKDLEFEFRVVRADGDVRWMLVRGHVMPRPGTDKLQGLGVILDITERKRAEERQQILIQELDHRVKNSLANIQLIMERSREQANSIDDFKAALEGRLMSMATTHSRLSKGGWTGVSLADICRDSLLPFAAEQNTTIDGPTVILKPPASQALAMVAFELATNAAKYGALSTRPGQVRVRWHMVTEETPAKQPKTLVITWEETGGAGIQLPIPSGYGTSVIRDLIPYELKGSTVAFGITGAGVHCRIEIPARFLVLSNK